MWFSNYSKLPLGIRYRKILLTYIYFLLHLIFMTFIFISIKKKTKKTTTVLIAVKTPGTETLALGPARPLGNPATVLGVLRLPTLLPALF